MGDHLLMHVVITILDHQLDIAVRVQPLADLFGDLHHLAFTRLKVLAVKIADDVVHLGPIHAAFDAGEVIKAFITFGSLRRLVGRHFGMNARGQRQRIDHHPFCGAGMHVIADNLNGHRGGVEVFKLQFPHATAVDGIGPAGIKGLDIEMLRPFSDLFIGGEGHADIAMRDVFRLQGRQRGHDIGDAGLVVRPQQRFPVGGDQRLPQKLMQNREHHRGEHLIADTQRDIAAAIVFDNLRINVFTAEIRGSIDVRDKADGRDIALHVGGQGSHYRPFFTQRYLDQSHFFQLRLQQA